MTNYLITYDLRAPGRNYAVLTTLLAITWKASKLAESVWLARLNGNAETVLGFLRQAVDQNDRLAVIEVPAGADWATKLGLNAGVNFLSQNVAAARAA